MKAVILAAGKGVRLRPITETRPKPLIPVLCKPLLLWHLDYLLTNSSLFDEIIIVVNYLKEKIIDAVRKHPLHELIRFIEQGEELGTGDAVYKAIKDLDDNEEVLVIYSDLFIADKELYGKILRTEGN
ncbi:MAG: nucleotidyl transferase, partial [Thermoprotei archaeon]